MTPDEIPQELIDLLDQRAGKQHSRQGPVVACLAEILTAWEEHLIKAWYGPATEDLLEQLMPKLVAADIQEEIAEVVIDGLKELGYHVSIEVEVHGDMAKALESLGGDTSNYVKMERPKRRT